MLNITLCQREVNFKGNSHNYLPTKNRFLETTFLKPKSPTPTPSVSYRLSIDQNGPYYPPRPNPIETTQNMP